MQKCTPPGTHTVRSQIFCYLVLPLYMYNYSYFILSPLRIITRNSYLFLFLPPPPRIFITRRNLIFFILPAQGILLLVRRNFLYFLFPPRIFLLLEDEILSLFSCRPRGIFLLLKETTLFIFFPPPKENMEKVILFLLHKNQFPIYSSPAAKKILEWG